MRHQQERIRGTNCSILQCWFCQETIQKEDRKKPLGLDVSQVGDLEGKAAGREFAGWIISHQKRSVHGKSKTYIVHLRQLWECPDMANFVCKESFAITKMGPMVQLLSHGFSLFFPTALPADPKGSERFTPHSSDCPRLPVKPVVTDKRFWRVICILGKLKCPFSSPWLSGQVIRLLIWCLR